MIEERQLVSQCGGIRHQLGLGPGRPLRVAFEAGDDFVLQAPVVASRNVLQPLVERGWDALDGDGRHRSGSNLQPECKHHH